ncbi:unnamed protein product [Staurois parvus]|uniref:Uncharacterized protein n=1 Tax=Staurois parvus TaxID=386267 RepID=A0ABN9CFE4_9NEOB|nr:unnamed protein product [Staurois parvus]
MTSTPTSAYVKRSPSSPVKSCATRSLGMSHTSHETHPERPCQRHLHQTAGGGEREEG